MTKATNMTPPPKLGCSWYRQTHIENQINPKESREGLHRRPTQSRTNSYLYLQKYTQMLHAKKKKTGMHDGDTMLFHTTREAEGGLMQGP